jgi:hypothetical protein
MATSQKRSGGEEKIRSGGDEEMRRFFLPNNLECLNLRFKTLNKK